MKKLRKVLNNNIVSTVDKQDREIILVGRGLGWGAKVGGEVDRSKNGHRIYISTDQSRTSLPNRFLTSLRILCRTLGTPKQYSMSMTKAL